MDPKDTRWSTVRAVCQVQFNPSVDDHSAPLKLVASLSDDFPQVQQMQIPGVVPVPTEQGNVMKQGTTPQWLLKHKNRPLQVAIQSQVITVEELEIGCGRSTLLNDAAALWQTLAEKLQPAEVTRIGIRNVQAALGGGPLNQLVGENPFIPGCLLDSDRRGHSRLEFEVAPKMRAIVVLGRNQSGVPILDLDLILEDKVAPFWPEILKKVESLYGEMEGILIQTLQQGEAELLLN